MPLWVAITPAAGLQRERAYRCREGAAEGGRSVPKNGRRDPFAERGGGRTRGLRRSASAAYASLLCKSKILSEGIVVG